MDRRTLRALTLLSLIVWAHPAAATLSWADCYGAPRDDDPHVRPAECKVATFTDDADDVWVSCLSDICTIALDGSGSVSVQKCVGVTTDGSNCHEEVELDSSDRADSLYRGNWWLDVTGSGTIEIGG